MVDRFHVGHRGVVVCSGGGGGGVGGDCGDFTVASDGGNGEASSCDMVFGSIRLMGSGGGSGLWVTWLCC